MSSAGEARSAASAQDAMKGRFFFQLLKGHLVFLRKRPPECR